MKQSIPMDSLLGLIFALGGIAILSQALTLQSLPGMNVGPGLFPSIVGAGMALMGAGLVVQGWLTRNDPDEDEAPPLFTWFAAGVVAVILGAIFLMPFLGFLICGTVFSFIVVLMSGGRWLPALIYSPIATGAIYALFTLALRVPLPRGLLG
ncbi:tripartite tricarboxylate transporter TctB family protein [Devosia sp. 2618]|uniref:tripartite tricarboxylate transporter TctB family protein n=1 Tax=Devosia sp. 2618 TaxID=3156454 RepID=UPI003398F8AA